MSGRKTSKLDCPIFFFVFRYMFFFEKSILYSPYYNDLTRPLSLWTREGTNPPSPETGSVTSCLFSMCTLHTHTHTYTKVHPHMSTRPSPELCLYRLTRFHSPISSCSVQLSSLSWVWTDFVSLIVFFCFQLSDFTVWPVTWNKGDVKP